MKKLVVLVFISLILVSSVYAFSFQELFSKITGKAVSEDYQLDDFMIDKICNDYENLGKLSYGECSNELRKSNGLFLAEQFCSEIGGNFDKGCYFGDELGTLKINVDFDGSSNFNRLFVGRNNSLWIKNSLDESWEKYDVRNSEFCDNSINNPFCNNTIFYDGIDYFIYQDIDFNGILDLGVGKKNIVWTNFNNEGWKINDISVFSSGLPNDPFNNSTLMAEGIDYYLIRDIDADGVLDAIVGKDDLIYVRSSKGTLKWNVYNLFNYCTNSQNDPFCNTSIIRKGLDFYYIEDLDKDGFEDVVVGVKDKIYYRINNSWQVSPSLSFCNNETNNPFCSNNEMIADGLDYYFVMDEIVSFDVNVESIWLLNNGSYQTKIKLNSSDFSQDDFSLKLPSGAYRIYLDSIPMYISDEDIVKVSVNQSSLAFLNIQENFVKGEPIIESVYPQKMGLIPPGQIITFYVEGQNFSSDTNFYVNGKEVKDDSVRVVSSQLAEITLYTKPIEGFDFSMVRDLMPLLVTFPEGDEGYYFPDESGNMTYNEGTPDYDKESYTISTKKSNSLLNNFRSLFLKDYTPSTPGVLLIKNKTDCIDQPGKPITEISYCGGNLFSEGDPYLSKDIKVSHSYQFIGSENRGKCIYLGEKKDEKYQKCIDGNVRYSKEKSITGRYTLNPRQASCNILLSAVGVPLAGLPCMVLSERNQQGDVISYILFPEEVAIDTSDYTYKYCKNRDGSILGYYDYTRYLDRKNLDLLQEGVVDTISTGASLEGYHQEFLKDYDHSKINGNCLYSGANITSIYDDKSWENNWLIGEISQHFGINFGKDPRKTENTIYKSDLGGGVCYYEDPLLPVALNGWNSISFVSKEKITGEDFTLDTIDSRSCTSYFNSVLDEEGLDRKSCYSYDIKTSKFGDLENCPAIPELFWP